MTVVTSTGGPVTIVTSAGRLRDDSVDSVTITAPCHARRGSWVLCRHRSTTPSNLTPERSRGGGVMTDRRDRRPRHERVAPELAIARLELRQISLLAVFPLLSDTEQQTLAHEHAAAGRAAADVLACRATKPDRSVPDVARLFFNFYFVFPNRGLVEPFFGGDGRPLKDAALVGAYSSITSGVSARDEFHAYLWDLICDEDRRAAAARHYARDRSLHSFPPSAHPAAIERYCRRIDTLMNTAECVPALLATWAVERNPDRLADLACADLHDKHGLLEQRHIARFMGMKPNTLAQSLKRFRARLGEEMRDLWGIEKTAAAYDEDDEP
jgi:hypothetical protein